jgi:hypothetical protein
MLFGISVRIWDIEPKYLCRQHLLGEHRELHGLWNILTVHNGQGGYSRHPETLRWVGKEKALYNRHQLLVDEMAKRGFNHNSELDISLANGQAKQDVFIDSIDRQYKILTEKTCDCIFED